MSTSIQSSEVLRSLTVPSARLPNFPPRMAAAAFFFAFSPAGPSLRRPTHNRVYNRAWRARGLKFCNPVNEWWTEYARQGAREGGPKTWRVMDYTEDL